MFLNLALNYGEERRLLEPQNVYAKKYYKKKFLLNKLMKNRSLKT